FSQFKMVASMMLSPILGIINSTRAMYQSFEAAKVSRIFVVAELFYTLEIWDNYHKINPSPRKSDRNIILYPKRFC
ncbi:MAG: hypothetical protein ACKOEV_16075, partial [Cytophagales bacterium]